MVRGAPEPLVGPESTVIGISIVFDDVTTARRLLDDLECANQQLESAYEELQSTVEEPETANEELQSTDDELRTINDVLRTAPLSWTR
ncbi:hypothetical protein [Saccharothrix yanglingensis]|uniref:PAC domain-containing protein n=1 Tax=Saccharothrix yanglingensis TaxID=659496 RepID=A0ABU0WWD1_9PSEU|nr:hypothetical protein [Saccharothrix yanglingensis]MDQ2584167.1 hypothetical protein [Saccharothrix yanglingensis]